MIETERLILRPHRLEDFDTMWAMSNDPDVMQYLTRGAPTPPYDVWNKLLRNIGHWTALGYGLFAVVDKTTGRYVGDTGLADFHRGLGDDFDPYPETAWVYAREAQGKGFATEAAIAAHDWFEEKFGKGRRVCIIDPDNAGSIALAQRLAYAVYDEADWKGTRVLKLERAG